MSKKMSKIFDKKFMIKERLKQLAEYKEISIRNFEQYCELKRGNISNMGENTEIGSDKLAKIIDKIPEINPKWLLTGRGSMLNKTESEKGRKKIPVFDVETIGGVNKRIANMKGVSTPSEWMDAGDWFMDATAAMHHYGDSMVEYPSGCILALREIFDFSLIVWGKAYVIETDEYRITKRLHPGDSDDYIIACSTNPDRYPDGKLIHKPVDISKQIICRLAIVLGYVVKEQSSGMIYNVRTKK
jgi:hypothetical protein